MSEENPVSNNNIKKVSGNELHSMYLNNMFYVIKYYIHMGYDPDSILRHIMSYTMKFIDSISDKFDEAYTIKQDIPGNFEFELLMKYNTNTNLIEETRGNCLGHDGYGRIILEQKENWIPKYPFEEIQMKDSGKLVWAVHNRNTLSRYARNTTQN